MNQGETSRRIGYYPKHKNALLSQGAARMHRQSFDCRLAHGQKNNESCTGNVFPVPAGGTVSDGMLLSARRAGEN